MKSLKEILAPTIVGAAFDLPFTDRLCAGGCGKIVRGPAATWCTPCGDASRAADQLKSDRVEIVPALESIPAGWRWATCEDIPLLERRVPRSTGIVEDALLRIPWQHGVTIRGPAGAGKTSLAAALFRAWVTHPGIHLFDRRTSRFILASRLSRYHPSEFDEATRAGCVLLDNVGCEGDMPSSRTPVADLLTERHAWERTTIVTTFHDQASIAGRYGDDIARRLFENTLVIDLGGARK